MADHPRVQQVDPERLTPEQREVFDRIAGTRGRVAGPFTVLLHAPDLADRVQNVGAYLRYETELERDLAETAVLVTARAWDSAFEWEAHEPHARRAGVPAEVIEALRDRCRHDGAARPIPHHRRVRASPRVDGARPRRGLPGGPVTPRNRRPGRAHGPGRVLHDAGDDPGSPRAGLTLRASSPSCGRYGRGEVLWSRTGTIDRLWQYLFSCRGGQLSCSHPSSSHVNPRGSVINTVAQTTGPASPSGLVVTNVARAVAHELRAARRRPSLPDDRPRQLAVDRARGRRHPPGPGTQRGGGRLHGRCLRPRPRSAVRSPTAPYGPGAANVAGALAEPFWSASPVVALVSAMRRTERFRKEYQELDQRPALRVGDEVGRRGIGSRSTSRASSARRRAARSAARPVPVYLGIPGDIFEEEMPDYQAPATHRRADRDCPLTRPAPSAADAEAVVRALTSAEPADDPGRHRHPPVRRVRRAAPGRRTARDPGRDEQRRQGQHRRDARARPRHASAATRATTRTPRCARPTWSSPSGPQLGGLVTDSYKLISPDASSSTSRSIRR